MNKIELEAAVAEATGVNRMVVNEVVEAVWKTVAEALSRGEPVRITGFATFAVKERAERQGKNPKTGETITIKASRKVTLRPGKDLNAAVNAA